MAISDTTTVPASWRAFAAGAGVGVLGGLIGLGGAEFRLPLLLMFGLVVLPAVIVNKAISLVVVASALVFRSSAVSPLEVAAQWPVMVNLLLGSLAGAWLAAGWATRWQGQTLQRVIALLLVLIAAALLLGHEPGASGPALQGAALWMAGVAAGFAIGVVASLLGVAGGELLIPTLVLLFGIELKLAGSVSLAISLPTMLVGFARYSRDRSFVVLGTHRGFVVSMAVGSLLGAGLGGVLLGVVPAAVLLPVLAAILVVSAIKLWRHA
ncbi:MAG: TSUP family transporter [Hydrogenophaga sp.]